jgi:glycosyltransferase involved in cell wall biosynthesis
MSKKETSLGVKKSPSVAIVCDWLIELGGAERVIKAVHEIYPKAPIYTSQFRPKQAVWFRGIDVRTGWLNKFPAALKRFIPFMRHLYFANLNLREYDIVISITGAEAKAVKTRPGALHISYMHAPTQYYWTLYDQYIMNPGFGILNPLARIGLRLLVKPLRRADYTAAQSPDIIVANSSYIQAEIKKFYHRDSVVIWPNVDVVGIQKLIRKKPQNLKTTGFIIYGRQVSWKRIDIAIEACERMQENLLVIGSGPEHENLIRLAKNSKYITFLPKYSGIAEIVSHIVNSKAYIFPSVEPFGIAPVESLAAGTPILALRKGGALDFVNNKNGIFFDEQTVESLCKAIKEFNTRSFDRKVVEESARKFSEDSFRKQFSTLVDKYSHKLTYEKK